MTYILIVFVTRPEVIKILPLYHELQKSSFKVNVCVTAQHREMQDQVLDFFEMVPYCDLDLMLPNQTLNGLSANILSEMDRMLMGAKPDLVLVHGDTTTSSMVAMAAFHLGIKVGHIEAEFSTLSGTDTTQIINTIQDILDNFIGFENSISPYGTGDASQKIVCHLLNQD
jgi:UDP-N-acetylglucosamine 2-epimerase (non-hydrolysing)